MHNINQIIIQAVPCPDEYKSKIVQHTSRLCIFFKNSKTKYELHLQSCNKNQIYLGGI